MPKYLHRWVRVSLLNLLIVAAIGVILRYKIAYSLPFVDQKHLLHGHSHFAFSGWVSQIIMALLVNYLSKHSDKNIFKKYRWILYANLITAYGMLISFPIQGYGLFSIIFSTLSIFVSYFFTVIFWKDLNKIKVKTIGHWWFKSALVFNVISSFGAFGLAYMMATKNIHQNWYLAAVYFFLHFQYNGWFFFSCMGLAIEKIFPLNFSTSFKKIFWLFAGACIPAYFLSALWMPIPVWIYVLVIVSAFAQLTGWLWILKRGIQELKKRTIILSSPSNWLIGMAALALTIKFLMQLGSTIPSLSNWAFGFRPIVIGYLHLVLLGCITLFLLGYLFAEAEINFNRMTKSGIIIFTSGIIINEALLMIQGIYAIGYLNLPFANEFLFCAALIMFSGILLLNCSQAKKYLP